METPPVVDFLGFLFSKSSTGYIDSSSVALAGSNTVAISHISQTTVYIYKEIRMLVKVT